MNRPPPPSPPDILTPGPDGAYLVHLLIYNGAPFHDHWAYWIQSRQNTGSGVLVHAAGNVRVGFEFEIKRSYGWDEGESPPTKRVPLQWVSGEYISEKAMLTSGNEQADRIPACPFEEVLSKVEVPVKSLRSADDQAAGVPKRVVQRDCQTWIVEAAEQLVKEHIFSSEVASYLRAIQQ
ncbi:hypothetical protein ASPCAL13375 [Aspergillus calidoustus]|uniref:Uncharacterized protein n=1 Tax=Aspergillus calidoustus TaxID=454130 RepID=A0A0U5GGJ2_ASPCI|nr:hypothetical protein ASPCAL13375 [Aspergillus calidoustus]